MTSRRLRRVLMGLLATISTTIAVARGQDASTPTAAPPTVIPAAPAGMTIPPSNAPVTIVIPIYPVVGAPAMTVATPGVVVWDSPSGPLAAGARTPFQDSNLDSQWRAMIPGILAGLRPVPAPAIPDDPPPHEGALIKIPFTAEPSDILHIDVLEALPGRPLEGERLVRPDGTISLDFYGDLDVKGLTLRQIKTKLILHLREYMTDEVLGLVGEHLDSSAASATAPEVSTKPEPPYVRTLPEAGPVGPITIPAPPDAPPRPPGTEPKPEETQLPEAPAPQARRHPIGRDVEIQLVRRQRERTDPETTQPLQAPKRTLHTKNPIFGTAPEAIARQPETGTPREPEPVANGNRYIIPPKDSDRVFVDVATYNSMYYCMLGDVAYPGRLPVTGDETVLDALIKGGGLLATADPNDIRVVRPGRGDRPGKVYKVDLDAIQEKGDPRTNYQIFPGDRIIVGRHPTVRATVEADRRLAASNAVLQNLMTYGFAMRALANVDEPYAPGSTFSVRMKVGGQTLSINLGPDSRSAPAADRQAVLRAWAEFYRATSGRAEGTPLDADLLLKGIFRAPTPGSAAASEEEARP